MSESDDKSIFIEDSDEDIFATSKKSVSFKKTAENFIISDSDAEENDEDEEEDVEVEEEEVDVEHTTSPMKCPKKTPKPLEYSDSDDDDNVVLIDFSKDNNTTINESELETKEAKETKDNTLELNNVIDDFNKVQKNIEKLTKFTKSEDIDKLPDGGKKVYQEIEKLKLQETVLKEKIQKLKHDESIKKNNEAIPKIWISPCYSRTPTTTSKNVHQFSDSIEDISPKATNSKKVYQLSDSSAENILMPTCSNAEQNDNVSSGSRNHFDDFKMEDIPNVPNTNFTTTNLGDQALETLNKQQQLTSNRLEQLHGSLTSRPSEDMEEKDPRGLTVPLMKHQRHALAWLKWREKQKPRGGILADDMGLGKTLTMISLILSSVNDDEFDDSDSSNSSDDVWYSKNSKKRYYGGTLVVCPASLINQWDGEIKKRVKRGLLSVLIYHGINRECSERKLSKYNVVLTTYQTLAREAANNTSFYKMEWNRVILDEAHIIRNHKSQASIATCDVYGKRRWALTGTPIQNKEGDLYAILKFLRCSPFDELPVWKRWVENKNDAGKQRLIALMKTLMLRRTKQELQSKGNLESLPDKIFETVEIDMDRDEKLVYQKILLFSQNLFAQFLSQRAEKHQLQEMNSGGNTNFTKAQKLLLQHHSNKFQQTVESHEILVLLLRLRQMCCQPSLIHKMLDQMESEISGVDTEDVNEDLLHRLQNMSVKEDEEVDKHALNYKFDTKIVSKNLLSKDNPIFDDDRQSSKIRAVLTKIEEILETQDKIIVVSQWTGYLNIISSHLDKIELAKYRKFTGEIPIKNRQPIVDEFNNPRSRVRILLLSLTAGGVGLNLVGANHLLLIDLHWNPQLEAQAQDRIYRFGQKKNVHIYKFLCKDTIEERILMLQQKKLACAEHVLTGTKSMSSKLSLDDLKLLFS